MPPKYHNPREYIISQPLPIPSHQGLVIKARSDKNYNCVLPTREEVFKSNYDRREKQLEQGYRSVNHKPYKLLGDLVLDQKKLILYSLGQLSEDKLEDASSSSDEEREHDKLKQEKKKGKTVEAPARIEPPKKFVLRRSQSGNQKSLGKEISSRRKIISSVKLGQGLFKIIHEKSQKNQKHELMIRKKMEEKKRTEWQPPHMSSSDEEEEDEDSNNDMELNIFMTQSDAESGRELPQGISNPGFQSRPTSSQLPRPSSSRPISSRCPSPTKSAISTTSSTGTLSKKKLKKRMEHTRPYTPLHSNINGTLPELEDLQSKESLLRQLCSLYWLLEALKIDHPASYVMAPISTCWQIKQEELDRNTYCKIPIKKILREKQMDSNWNRFYTGQMDKETSHIESKVTLSVGAFKRVNIFQKGLKEKAQNRRLAATQFGSSLAPPGQTQQLRKGSLANGDITSMRSLSPVPPPPSPIPTEESAKKEGDGQDYDTMMMSFLDSLHGEKPKPSEETATKQRPPSPRKDSAWEKASLPTSASSKGRAHRLQQSKAATATAKKNLLSKQQLEEKLQEENIEKQVHRWVVSMERMYRARSAPTKRKDVPFMSGVKGSMPTEMRNSFIDVSDEKNLVLNDTLQEIEKKRLWRTEEKFKVLFSHKNARHVSKQLDAMKKAAEPKETEEEKRLRKLAEEECKWFQALKNNIPPEMTSDRQISMIMERLQNIGNIESRKATPHRFCLVLANLRSFEICHPDISSAIEFVRDRVIGMPQEDFEAWFKSEKPEINRAQSAPPT